MNTKSWIFSQFKLKIPQTATSFSSASRAFGDFLVFFGVPLKNSFVVWCMNSTYAQCVSNTPNLRLPRGTSYCQQKSIVLLKNMHWREESEIKDESFSFMLFTDDSFPHSRLTGPGSSVRWRESSYVHLQSARQGINFLNNPNSNIL